VTDRKNRFVAFADMTFTSVTWWFYGRTNRWLDANRWLHRRTDWRLNADGWFHGRTDWGFDADRWFHRWADGWLHTHGRMNNHRRRTDRRLRFAEGRRRQDVSGRFGSRIRQNGEITTATRF